jgi:hypothetical protein
VRTLVYGTKEECAIVFTLYALLALVDRNLLIFRYLQEHSVSLGKLCSRTIFCHIFFF